MTTGELIKFYRERLEMTQEQLADAMGYAHKSSINKIEMGKADLPQSKLVAFARILGVTPCDLISGEPIRPATEEQIQLWDETLNKNGQRMKEVILLQHIQEHFGADAVKILELFSSLNKSGKEKAIENLEDLTAIQKYIEKKGE